jgi:hypothetical protein
VGWWRLARHGELLGPEEVRTWQKHLIEVQRRSPSMLIVATAALRFPYNVTLKRDGSVDELLMSRTPRRLPVGADESRTMTVFRDGVPRIHAAALRRWRAAGAGRGRTAPRHAAEIASGAGDAVRCGLKRLGRTGHEFAKTRRGGGRRGRRPAGRDCRAPGSY